MPSITQIIVNILLDLLPALILITIPIYYSTRYFQNGNRLYLDYAIISTILFHLIAIASTPVLANASSEWYIWDFAPGQSNFADTVYLQLFAIIAILFAFLYSRHSESKIVIVLCIISLGILLSGILISMWYWYVTVAEILFLLLILREYNKTN